MIDNFSIFITTVTIVFVIWRAAKLDRTLPWFPPASKDRPSPPPAAEPWQQPSCREVVPVWRR